MAVPGAAASIAAETAADRNRFVVYNDSGKIRSQRKGCGEVEGVERSEIDGEKSSRSVEHVGVDSNHVAFCEQPLGSRRSSTTSPGGGASQLGAMKVRQDPASGAKPPPQRFRFRFGTDELGQSRGVEIQMATTARPTAAPKGPRSPRVLGRGGYLRRGR